MILLHKQKWALYVLPFYTNEYAIPYKMETLKCCDAPMSVINFYHGEDKTMYLILFRCFKCKDPFAIEVIHKNDMFHWKDQTIKPKYKIVPYTKGMDYGTWKKFTLTCFMESFVIV